MHIFRNTFIVSCFLVFVALGLLVCKFARTELLEYRDGLNTQASDLGWIPRTASESIVSVTPTRLPALDYHRSVGTQAYQALYGRPQARKISYLAYGTTLKSNLMHVVHSLAQGRRDARGSRAQGLTSTEMSEILKSLAAYAPLALQAQEELSKAVATRIATRRARHKDSADRTNAQIPRLQYGSAIQDEYDAVSQYPETPVDKYGAMTQGRLHFNEKDIPVLSCGPTIPGAPPMPYTPHLDTFDDCVLNPQKTFNKMYSLDRLRSGAPPATPEQVHAHMRRVDRFVNKWKDLLVGDGGGDGPGSFDDPYYFCYDQYQEDPEFTQCLQDLAQDKAKGPFAVHKWAANDGRGETHSVMSKDEKSVGFPELNKEWKKELRPDDTGEWVRMNKDSAVTADGSSWAPLGADSPAEGQLDAKHLAPFAADNLPSPVDGLVGA